MSSERDDRWSSFKTALVQQKLLKEMRDKNAQDVTTVDDCLGRILMMKAQRKQQENACKAANSLVKQITGFAHALNPEWKSYIPAGSDGGVNMVPLRSLAKDAYECMVPLVRPMRLDGFQVVQRPLDEMAQHRCLIQLNDSLSRQERNLVASQWEDFIDVSGCLAPKAILKWFNKGLADSVPVVLSENHNVDKLACAVGDDGTATLNATVTEFNGEQLHVCVLSINIYPVYVMDRLPKSLKLAAPIPCFGGYIQGQKRFRQLVHEDMENGKHVAFLDPKIEQNNSPITRCMPKDGLSWKMNLSFTEYHVYAIIDKYCRGLDFRHVLVLLSLLREENPELSVLNNDILVSTLFSVSQKHIDVMRTKDQWMFTTMQTLCEGLKHNFLPCFYLPRQNLLDTYHISKTKQGRALEKLGHILTSIKCNPKAVYKFTGYTSLESRNGSGKPRIFRAKKYGSAHAKSDNEKQSSDVADGQLGVNDLVKDAAKRWRTPNKSAAKDDVTEISRVTRGERSDIY